MRRKKKEELNVRKDDETDRERNRLKKKGMRKEIYLPSNVEEETNEEVRIRDE